jgi:hypothetical protein
MLRSLLLRRFAFVGQHLHHLDLIKGHEEGIS